MVLLRMGAQLGSRLSAIAVASALALLGSCSTSNSDTSASATGLPPVPKSNGSAMWSSYVTRTSSNYLAFAVPNVRPETVSAWAAARILLDQSGGASKQELVQARIEQITDYFRQKVDEISKTSDQTLLGVVGDMLLYERLTGDYPIRPTAAELDGLARRAMEEISAPNPADLYGALRLRAALYFLPAEFSYPLRSELLSFHPTEQIVCDNAQSVQAASPDGLALIGPDVQLGEYQCVQSLKGEVQRLLDDPSPADAVTSARVLAISSVEPLPVAAATAWATSAQVDQLTMFMSSLSGDNISNALVLTEVGGIEVELSADLRDALTRYVLSGGWNPDSVDAPPSLDALIISALDTARGLPPPFAMTERAILELLPGATLVEKLVGADHGALGAAEATLSPDCGSSSKRQPSAMVKSPTTLVLTAASFATEARCGSTATAISDSVLHQMLKIPDIQPLWAVWSAAYAGCRYAEDDTALREWLQQKLDVLHVSTDVPSPGVVDGPADLDALLSSFVQEWIRSFLSEDAGCGDSTFWSLLYE